MTKTIRRFYKNFDADKISNLISNLEADKEFIRKGYISRSEKNALERFIYEIAGERVSIMHDIHTKTLSVIASAVMVTRIEGLAEKSVHSEGFSANLRSSPENKEEGQEVRTTKSPTPPTSPPAPTVPLEKVKNFTKQQFEALKKQLSENFKTKQYTRTLTPTSTVAVFEVLLSDNKKISLWFTARKKQLSIKGEQGDEYNKVLSYVVSVQAVHSEGSKENRDKGLENRGGLTPNPSSLPSNPSPIPPSSPLPPLASPLPPLAPTTPPPLPNSNSHTLDAPPVFFEGLETFFSLPTPSVATPLPPLPKGRGIKFPTPPIPPPPHSPSSTPPKKHQDSIKRLKKLLPVAFDFLTEQSKVDLSLGLVDIFNDKTRLSDYSILLVPPYRGLERLIFDIQSLKDIEVKMIGQAFEKNDKGEYLLKASYRKKINSVVYNEVCSALYTEYSIERHSISHSDNTSSEYSREELDLAAARAKYIRLLGIIDYNCKKLLEIGAVPKGE